jgi:hypothetical protein
MSITEEQVAALEAQHGEIAVLRCPEFAVVFRKPTRTEHKMFRANVNNPARASDAQEILSKAIVVYPPPAEYEKLLDKFPGVPDSPAFSKAIMRLVRMSVEESEK